MTKLIFKVSAAGVVSLSLLFAVYCNSRADRSRWEKSVSSASVPAMPANGGMPAAIALPPAGLRDVRQAIARVYGDAVELPSGSPHYVIGDFNGDESEDLAVEVRPVIGKLAKLNDDFANWILQDPSQIFVPDPTKRVQHLPAKHSPPRVRSGERLLAIIHGYGPQGWREPMARQGYLLSNTSGKAIALKKKNDVPAQMSNLVPHLFGDLIQVKRSDNPSMLFWTGGHYAWLEKR